VCFGDQERVRDVDVAADGNSAEAHRFGRRRFPPRAKMAHDGWAIDVLDVLARPREETIRIKSVVE
jgi:hypothetical protein